MSSRPGAPNSTERTRAANGVYEVMPGSAIRFLEAHTSHAGHPVTACITGEEEVGGAALRAVRVMESRLLKLGWPVGRPLGTVAEVQKTFGLGRPASREAINILEARGLVETRRGPGGGIFVSAPTLDDVAQMLLVYLEIGDAPSDCVGEFRLLVWRMIIEATVDCAISPTHDDECGKWGFAFDLACRLGNPTMAFAARLAEMLARTCGLPAAPQRDTLLDTSLRAWDLKPALARLPFLAQAEYGATRAPRDIGVSPHPSSRGKPATTLAMRLVRELRDRPDHLEAEWETAERLGCTEILVRQARRILEDHNFVHCRRGSKGAALKIDAGPASLIRLLVPCLIANGASLMDNRQVAYFLTSEAAALAARRGGECQTLLTEPCQAQDGEEELVAMFEHENVLLESSGNPLLVILVRSLGLADFHFDEAPHWRSAETDMMAFNQRILTAINTGDAETARMLARTKSDFINSLLDDHPKAA